MLEFFSTYYVARNAVISIVGDLEKAEAIKLSETLSEEIQQGERPIPIPDVTIPVGLTTIIDKNVKGTISAAEATKPGGCCDPPGKDKSFSIFLFRSTTERIPETFFDSILWFGT